MSLSSSSSLDIPQSQTNDALALEFIDFALSCGVLRFGEFITKAGRVSPYFFNAGLFDTGAKLQKLASFYARRIIESALHFDVLFGPAYKGIPLVAAVAIELSRLGVDKPLAYNRKEIKDHGEGGNLVGAPLQGSVLVIDDVISAGTAMRESTQLIRQAGATPFALCIALDRQEKATQQSDKGIIDLPYSAVQHIQRHEQLHVLTVATLDDLLSFLEINQSSCSSDFIRFLPEVQAYRARYGVVYSEFGALK